MRTTIELPDDLHQIARELAHQEGTSMGQIVAKLMRQGLRPQGASEPTSDRGIPVVTVGRVVTSEDVRSLDDEE